MNGDASVSADQCDQRMAGVRGEMVVGFAQIQRDLKEILKTMDDTRKEVAAAAAAEAVRQACAKLDETKARAAERAEDQAAMATARQENQERHAEEKAARTLKDTLIEHRIEIGMIILGLLIAGKGVVL